MKNNKIEPCDICKMEYTKEMCKIANKFFQDNDPCFCQAIKKVEKMINEKKKLKKEIKMLEEFIAVAQPEDWDLDGVYGDALYGRFNGNEIEGIKPDKEFAEWIRERYNLDKIEEDED